MSIPATVLRYPLNAQHPIPLDAVRSDVRRLRTIGVARVGVIGFSAGGHLAGQAALSGASSIDTRIDLAVLGYAIASMEMETYRPARLILVGDDAPPELRRATSLDALVTAAAPPFFIWHTAEDPYVPVEHSYLLAAALAAHDVPHALHVFSQGPHSLGLAYGAGEPRPGRSWPLPGSWHGSTPRTRRWLNRWSPRNIRLATLSASRASARPENSSATPRHPLSDRSHRVRGGRDGPAGDADRADSDVATVGPGRVHRRGCLPDDPRRVADAGVPSAILSVHRALAEHPALTIDDPSRRSE